MTYTNATPIELDPTVKYIAVPTKNPNEVVNSLLQQLAVVDYGLQNPNNDQKTIDRLNELQTQLMDSMWDDVQHEIQSIINQKQQQ